MADVHDVKTRSYNMSRISGKNTKPEMIVRKFLHACGFRYRLHAKDLPGKPDLVLPKYNTVIFVHGCFWHAHEGCESFVMPKSRLNYWEPKLSGNKKRDEKNFIRLKEIGWNVLVVWECDLKQKFANKTLSELIRKLKENEHK